MDLEKRNLQEGAYNRSSGGIRTSFRTKRSSPQYNRFLSLLSGRMSLTQVRMGKIIKDKYPGLDEEDQEAVRQHAIAALNLTQKAKEAALEDASSDTGGSNALIQGVRKFAMDVRELDIDLIDRINPFGEAYAILAKTMSEESLKQVAAVISAKKVQLTPDEARDLAKRALKFKQARGRLPSITSPDAWEKRMAEGVAFLARMKQEAASG